MKTLSQKVVACACAAALSLTFAGCAQQAEQAEQPATQEATEDQGGRAAVRDESDPAADGRIDVTQTGSQVATFRGSKYIVSDVTVDQQTGEGLTEGLGLQEICVVEQPAEWGDISSIGWDRNSISYTNVAMPWGTASYRYEYVNEASGVEGTEEFSRASEEAYFAGFDQVEHVDVDGHAVSYMVDDAASGAMGIEDLEAEGMGVEVPQRTISAYCFEQRADKCAFLATVTYQVADDSAFDLSAEDVVRDAYAPLRFFEKGGEVDAASYLSDVVITSADGASELTIARNGNVLVSYTEHSVLMLDEQSVSEDIATVSFDYAAGEAPYDDLTEYEIAGHVVRAREEEGMLGAWVDMAGGTLYVETGIDEVEDVETVLNRIVGEGIAAQE